MIDAGHRAGRPQNDLLDRTAQKGLFRIDLPGMVRHYHQIAVVVSPHVETGNDSFRQSGFRQRGFWKNR